MKKSVASLPIAYFITFTTYGTWLHGDKRGSLDPKHRTLDTPRRKPNNYLYHDMKKEKCQQAMLLNTTHREIVMQAIRSTCQYYNWHLYAIHVRQNHVHLVVQAADTPEKIMTQLKAYASRALNKLIGQIPTRQYWSRHGSTRCIWSEPFLLPAMHYVIDQQGPRMACYYDYWYDQLQSF